jgi:hypothetical protein
VSPEAGRLCVLLQAAKDALDEVKAKQANLKVQLVQGRRMLQDIITMLEETTANAEKVLFIAGFAKI